jgi:hypothetical protein
MMTKSYRIEKEKQLHIEMGYVTIVAWNNRVTTRALAFYLYIDRRWCE